MDTNPSSLIKGLNKEQILKNSIGNIYSFKSTKKPTAIKSQKMKSRESKRNLINFSKITKSQKFKSGDFE